MRYDVGIMNTFKLKGFVTRIKTFGTPSGNFVANLGIRCESQGSDGQIRENTINCKIWHNQVNDIREGDLIEIDGTLRNNKSKDKFGNESWQLEASGTTFRFIEGNTPAKVDQPLKSNPGRNVAISQPQSELTEQDVPF